MEEAALAKTANTAATEDVGRAITVLLEIYKENTNHGRHLETQRQLVTGIVFTLTAAIFGCLVALKFPATACRGVGIMFIAVGLLGTTFSILLYGKYAQCRARWRAARTVLTKLCPLASLETIRAASKPAMGNKRNPSLWLQIGELPLHWLWSLLPLSVAILGVLVVSYSSQLAYWANQK